MTHLCEKIISTLPSWRKLNGPNQLMSLQQFVYDVQDQLNPLASEDDLRRIAQQLHSTGEVRAEGGRAPAGRGEKTLLPVVSHPTRLSSPCQVVGIWAWSFLVLRLFEGLELTARLIYIHHKDSFFKAKQQCRSERNTLTRLTAGHRGEGVQEPGSSL